MKSALFSAIGKVLKKHVFPDKPMDERPKTTDGHGGVVTGYAPPTKAIAVFAFPDGSLHEIVWHGAFPPYLKIKMPPPPAATGCEAVNMNWHGGSNELITFYLQQQTVSGGILKAFYGLIKPGISGSIGTIEGTSGCVGTQGISGCNGTSR